MNKLIKNWFVGLKSSLYLKNVLTFFGFLLLFFIFLISISVDSIYPFNILLLALIVAFGLIVLSYWFIFKRNIIINMFTLCCFALIICFILSWAINGFRAFPKTPIFVTILAFLTYVWLSDRSSQYKIFFVLFAIASIFFVILFTVTEIKYIVSPNFSRSIGSRYGNENDVARHLVFSLAIFLIAIHYLKKRMLKIVLLLFCLLSVYLIILTGSFSNMILSLVIVITFLFFQTKTRKARLITLAALSSFLILIICLISFVPALYPIKNRFLSIVSTFFNLESNVRGDSSSEGRFYAAIYGFKLFFQSPLFGNGYNSVVSNYKIMAHNNIAEISADYGIFALIIEELLLFVPLFKRKKTDIQKLLILPLLYLLLIQLFLVSFNSKIDCIMLAIIYSLGSFSKSLSFNKKTLLFSSSFERIYCEVDI